MMNDLTATEFRFYHWLKDNPDCLNMSAAEMAEECEVGARRISQLLAGLADKGYIRIDRKRRMVCESKITIL